MTGRAALTVLRPSSIATSTRLVHSPWTPRHFSTQHAELPEETQTALRFRGQTPTVPIHLIGLGAMGMYVAAALRNVARPPPVGLLSHKNSLIRAWHGSDQTITINSYDDSTIVSSDFSMSHTSSAARIHGISTENPQSEAFEHDRHVRRPHQIAKDIASTGNDSDAILSEEEELREEVEHDDADMIDCLIVTVKCPRTVPALDGLKHRLNSDSTVVLLQNGMGQQDELNKKVFPDPTTRPQYVSATVSHGVASGRDPFAFRVRWNGRGHIFMSPTPRPRHLGVPASLKYVLDIMTSNPTLRASVLPSDLFRERQFMKLAVNAVVNPLTALTDHRNGCLLHNYAMTKTMRLLIAEISLILRSLPELQPPPPPPTSSGHITAQSAASDSSKDQLTDPESTLTTTTQDIFPPENLYNFSPSRIENQVLQVATTTRNNISSMLVDVRRGLKTEIEYLNGYIVRRGQELGIAAPVNMFVASAVRAKQLMIDRDQKGDVPIRET